MKTDFLPYSGKLTGICLMVSKRCHILTKHRI